MTNQYFAGKIPDTLCSAFFPYQTIFQLPVADSYMYQSFSLMYPTTYSAHTHVTYITTLTSTTQWLTALWHISKQLAL